MTKDEMVQDFYVQLCMNGLDGEDALKDARNMADYFFKNYKPKKKREVLRVPRRSLQRIDYTYAPTHIVFRDDSIETMVEILEALQQGKSVRMK